MSSNARHSNAVQCYERRCRALLRAYPVHYRSDRGDELLGTLLDAAEPGRRTPGLRTTADVLIAGVRTRLREHPPLPRWLAYRFGTVALPQRYHPWAHADITGRWYPLRVGLAVLAVFSLNIALYVVNGLPIWPWLTIGGFVVFLELLRIDRVRARMLARHGGPPTTRCRRTCR